MAHKHGFYDALAEHYHLIFDDWDAAMRRQGEALAALLPSPTELGPILDCACGIGTQSLALATRGFQVDASDLSAAAVARTGREATARGLSPRVWVDDMRSLSKAPAVHYGAVLCLDNALPHLDSDQEIESALHAMYSRLRPGGCLILSLRDYGSLIRERPAFMPPSFFRKDDRRRIVFQLWDWLDERRYTLHLYISSQTEEGWEDRHFIGDYRAVLPDEVVLLALSVGFTDVQVRAPEETGYYQPIITGRRA